MASPQLEEDDQEGCRTASPASVRLRCMTILRLECVATPRQGSMSIPSADCEC